MKMLAAESVLTQYTAEQWGLVTSAQAKRAGVDGVTLQRMVEAGLLERVRWGVYAATAAPESVRRAEQALWLALQPKTPAWERDSLEPGGGVLSHGTAARLHELGELVEEGIEVTVPRRHLVRDPEVRVRVRALKDEDVTLVDGLPVTTAARTVADLLEDHYDASHVATIIREAHAGGLLDLDELADRIGPYARRYGVPGKDGHRLLDHVLSHIGTSVELLTHPPRPVSAYRGLAAAQLSPDVLTALANIGAFSGPALTTKRMLEQVAKSVGAENSAVMGAVLKNLRADLPSVGTVLAAARMLGQDRPWIARSLLTARHEDDDANDEDA